MGSQVNPKGDLVHGCPRCPHCQKLTNSAFRWYPAMNCWNCGQVMWRDDKGRSMEDRGNDMASCGLVVESDDDAKRLVLSRTICGTG